jgi:hypothetical protein
MQIEQTKPRLGCAGVNPANEPKDAQSLTIIRCSDGAEGTTPDDETNPMSK